MKFKLNKVLGMSGSSPKTDKPVLASCVCLRQDLHMYIVIKTIVKIILKNN